MAQIPEHPFTEDELYRALRLMKVPEVEAHEAAQAAVAVQRRPPQSSARSEHRTPAPPVPGQPQRIEEFQNVPTIQFTDDTLILLSLLSEKVRAKVERYRAALRGNTPPDPAEEAEWQRRRSELERILRTDRQDDPSASGR